MSAEHNDGYAAEALGGLEEKTAVLCADVSGCVEGYSSPAVELLRFESKETAGAFAASHPDSHQSDWIVIVYRARDLSDQGRTELETLIDTMWTSD
ncbi:MAG: hypothetical protein QM630_10095 [Microbacterium sp.]